MDKRKWKLLYRSFRRTMPNHVVNDKCVDNVAGLNINTIGKGDISGHAFKKSIFLQLGKLGSINHYIRCYFNQLSSQSNACIRWVFTFNRVLATPPCCDWGLSSMGRAYAYDWKTSNIWHLRANVDNGGLEFF